MLECWGIGVLGVIKTEVYGPYFRQNSEMTICSGIVIEHKQIQLGVCKSL